MLGGGAPGQLYLGGAPLFPRVTARGPGDTGATITESLQSSRSRALVSTGATVSDSLGRKVVRVLSSTGVSLSDSIISQSNHVSRAVSDTGVSFSSSVDAHKVRSFSFSETGALVNDSVGSVFLPETPSRIGVDSYADGTSTTFGSYSPIVEDLSIFTDVFEPYVPPLTETEDYYANLPFLDAERKLAETRPLAGSAKHVSCSWHGLVVDSKRGAFVIVRAGGELEGLVGERVRIIAGRGRASGENSVVGFVYATADLDPRDELSVTRRMFMGLGLLGLDRINVVVETLA